MYFQFVVLIAAALLSSCRAQEISERTLSSVASDASGASGAATEAPTGSELYANSKYYFSTVDKIVVEILYEPGAEPYVGKTVKGKDLWSFLSDNLKALYAKRTKIPQIDVPIEIASMKAIPAQNTGVWSAEALIAVSSNYRAHQSTETTAYFTLAFLKGYAANSDGQADKAVIGFNVTGTPYIAMFKDVIASTASSSDLTVPKYVEQSTLIHEIGHAIGLVNHGINMFTQHQDTEHGAHCTNSNCVMYWLNEGVTDLKSYAMKVIKTGNTVMYGQECLDDAANFVP